MQERAIDLRDAGVIAFEEHPIRGERRHPRHHRRRGAALEPKLAIPPDPAYTMQRARRRPARSGGCAARSPAKTRRGDRYRRSCAARFWWSMAAPAECSPHRASYAAPRDRELRWSWAAQIAGAKLPTLRSRDTWWRLAFPEELAMTPAEREAEPRVAPRPALALVLHHSAQQWTLRCGQHGRARGL